MTHRRGWIALNQMTTSTERGAIAGTSQTASRLSRLLRHPLWTTGTVVRGLAATPGPATVRRAVSHLLSRVFPLRLTIPTRRWSEAADSGAAVRWAGPINLRHRTLEALLCLPPGGIEYRTKAPAGARFVCECGLSPEVWDDQPPAIDFTIEIDAPAADRWQRRVTVTVDPGRRWTDRRWHTVSIDMPPVGGAAIDVTVVLRTSVNGAGLATKGWALFGEPRFESRRGARAVWSSIATFARRIRRDGLRPTLEVLRSAGVTTADADPRRRAALPAAHQHRHSDLQHRSGVASIGVRVHHPPGLSPLAGLRVRRRVDLA
jgi:hypothetical protein